jgi:thiol:disulfide interchange protein DsbD
MTASRAVLALLLSCAPLLAQAAIDPRDLLPIDEAYVLTATAPERGRVEFTWKIEDGYYLYRHRMSVQPVDSSFKFNPLELPPGKRRTDEFFGDVETYRDSVTAVLTGAAATGVESVTFNVKYQGCADAGICYPPHSKRITVALPPAASAATDAPFALPAPGAPNPLQQALGGAPSLAAPGTEALPMPPEEAFGFEAIAASPVELLLRFTPAPGYYLYRDRSSFRIVAGGDVALAAPQWPPGSPHEDEHFGAVTVYFGQIEVPLPLRRMDAKAQSITLEATFQGCQTDGICYPPMTRRVDIELPAATAGQVVARAEARSAGTPEGGVGFLVALLLAFGGGLILNLMPCVLPVLSLKAVSLAESGRSGGHARASALWYTAGVLAAFVAVGLLVMALRTAGLALGWGFQLQQPGIVALLALVVFAIGLNLSGLFEVGAGLAGSGQSLADKPGRAGDFFTGVLAVVVASPCTAPFMGTALAFAFAAPAPLALGVFVALGLGLAAPFLLIGFVPAMARLLPRPGLWMETFKQVLAFPMYLTAVWLAWVLGKQRGVDAVGLVLAGAVVVGAGLWWWGRQGLRSAPLARGIAVVLLAIGLGAVWLVHALPAPTQAATSTDGSEPYSAARLEALRAEGRAVFVNMTADWCVTCKVNEKNVLSAPAFAAAMKAANAAYLKGDWTNVDPEITRFLEAHDSVGVPLYVVFGPQGDGIVLPTVLSQSALDAALAQARR